MTSGFDIIREYLKDMPTLSGVYRMLDKDGNALYIGKAKNLKNRVSNYVSASGLSTRILKMISHTTSMEIVITANEAEALLLEANLVRKLKPRYNILLRDDKSFPYILLTSDHEYPQIVKHRGARKEKGEYFGPFASAGAVNETLFVLERAFLLRSCTDNYFKNRTRPCLQYQIKRCSAPCVNYIAKDKYDALVADARLFLKGKSREIQDVLLKQMQEESANENYEQAAILRDRIAALTRVQLERNSGGGVNLGDADVIALYRESEKSCVQVFFYRGGQNFGNRSFFPSHEADATDAEILTAFIGQFYVTHAPSPLIIISHELPDAATLEEALTFQAEAKVELLVPQRGDKKLILDKAVVNAKEALMRNVSENAANTQLLERLGELFEMKAAPERVEIYDNSHISGTHMVGAMITASKNGFEKKHYRRFNIRNTELTPGDDYAMMREVLTRRFKRLQKEEQQFPDLVLIDGGEGQLSATAFVFSQLGIENVTFVSVAKGPDRNAGREWMHMPGRPPFQMEPHDPVLHYIQRLRDEAHRFAIGSHRIKRSNAIRESALDQIPNIGAMRKRALLQHFGSSKGVQAAAVSDLMQVEGISKIVAQKIYDFFRG